MTFIYDIFRWLGKATEDSATGLPSVKRVIFAMVVTFLLGVTCGTSAVAIWTAYQYSGNDFIKTVSTLLSFTENMSAMLLAAVTTGYIGGKVAEKSKGAQNASQD